MTQLSATHDVHARWVLPKLITRKDVETWLAALDESVGAVTFHLGQDGCASGPGASESLQSAVCLLQRRGVRTYLTFPPGTFADPARRALFLDEPEEVGGTPAERTLAYRLPGLMLAQLCDPAPGATDVPPIRSWQVEAINHHRNLFGHGRYRALAVIGREDHRTQLRDSERVRADKLESVLLRMLGTHVYHPSRSAGSMPELVEFLFQATDNTFDHSRRDFDGSVVQQVRSASVERYIVGTGAGARSVEQLFPDLTATMRTYVERAQRRAATRGQDPERMRLWSITVADGGVGIAARMHGGVDIYEADLGHEYKLVQEAVLPEGTTKPLGERGRGRGLVKMMRATHRLGGLLQLRTGRLSLSRSYLTEDGESRTDLDFTNRHSPAFDLAGDGEEHVLTAGTVVSVLFPAFDLGPHDSSARDRA